MSRSTRVNAHDNFVFGISLQTASSAVLSDVTTSHNGVHGLDLETGSAAEVTGSLTVAGNRVFGVNVNGSSITFSRATASVSGNALGIQIATSANAFINDRDTVINVDQQFQHRPDGRVRRAHGLVWRHDQRVRQSGQRRVGQSRRAGSISTRRRTLNAFNNGDGVAVQEDSVDDRVQHAAVLRRARVQHHQRAQQHRAPA